LNKIPVIAIFDVGKTNKKLYLFDEEYNIVFEKTARFIETIDEDGDVCENIESLRLSIYDSLKEVILHTEFDIKAVNFSAYGASFVFVDNNGNPLTPLYNYLKKYPANLQNEFYEKYGGETVFAHQTASPVLGSLNSGMQLYRIKKENPAVFEKIKYALHLPQYLSYILTGKMTSDITSIGCHTNLWNFPENSYHQWLKAEEMEDKLAPIVAGDQAYAATFFNQQFKAGIGLHDSSAALIPYLINFKVPFVLISTGTWCISLNPFNKTPLTTSELANDCLCYLSFKGNPVKASRLFAGNEHEEQVKRIAAFFNHNSSQYKNIDFNYAIIKKLEKNLSTEYDYSNLKESVFAKRNLSDFSTDIEAYHQLIMDIVQQQFISTTLILEGTSTKRIFVDGGFSKNNIYMNLLAIHFKGIEIFAASMAQASSVGAALAIHSSWNRLPVPNDIIELKYFATDLSTF